MNETPPVDKPARRFSPGERVLVWVVAVTAAVVFLPGPFWAAPAFLALVLGISLIPRAQRGGEIIEEGLKLYPALVVMAWWAVIAVGFIWPIVHYWGQ